MTESTVFIVDDDPSIRDSLRWLLDSVQVNSEGYASAAEFLEAYDPSRPGCLVLDIRMPGMSGFELQTELERLRISIPIVIMTGHGDIPMCVRAFDGGAFAFVEKPVNQQALLDYIRKALARDIEERRRDLIAPEIAERRAKLTPREREVMEHLLKGKALKQIASELNVSIPTVSKHRTQVLEKMQVENDVELVKLLLVREPTSDGK